ncbi:DUF177 domain-containing protein [bacterium]|nr:DUF177 domain-containing protein [bacterium]
MKIRLNEIPEEGRNYIFNRQTAELNPALQDLIQNNAYDVNLDIKPLNSKDYTVIGTLKTKTHEQCSRCAEEFDLPIDTKLREILIPHQEEGRTGHYAKSGVSMEDEDNTFAVTEYQSMQFDLGEYLHEAIALQVPFNPFCAECSKPENNKAFIYDEKMGEEVKPNPFQALKGIKLN